METADVLKRGVGACISASPPHPCTPLPTARWAAFPASLSGKPAPTGFMHERLSGRGWSCGLGLRGGTRPVPGQEELVGEAESEVGISRAHKAEASLLSGRGSVFDDFLDCLPGTQPQWGQAGPGASRLPSGSGQQRPERCPGLFHVTQQGGDRPGLEHRLRPDFESSAQTAKP